MKKKVRKKILKFNHFLKLKFINLKFLFNILFLLFIFIIFNNIKNY